MSHPTPFLRRRRLLAGALLGAAISAPAAYACPSPVARVDVYDRSEQRTLDIHRHRGRHYIVGQPGHEYAIRIRNCSDRRVLAVVSVDGVNVVTGETAAQEQSGYVIEPYGHVTIQGWRKDLERTAAFYFSDPGDAYAAVFRPVKASQSFLSYVIQVVSLFGTSFHLKASYNESKGFTLKLPYGIVIKKLIQYIRRAFNICCTFHDCSRWYCLSG